QATRYGRNPAPTVQRTAADLRAAGDLRRDVLELNGGPTRSDNGTPTDPPASRGFSDTELREARAYLRLPASRAYLRGRHETDHVLSGELPVNRRRGWSRVTSRRFSVAFRSRGARLRRAFARSNSHPQ